MCTRLGTELRGFNSIEAELANATEMRPIPGKILTMTPLPVTDRNTSLRYIVQRITLPEVAICASHKLQLFYPFIYRKCTDKQWINYAGLSFKSF